MKITKASDLTDGPAAAEYFTGAVTMAPLRQPEGPDRASALRVQFAPGARTNWHTHPLGQLLIVIDGEGWAQTDGQAKQVIRPGDTIWIPAGERHWHGATAETGMIHIAVQEAQDRRSADWAEPVSDSDYNG